VAAELTSRDRIEEIVHVRAGEQLAVTLEIPGPPLSPALTQQLVTQNIQVDANYSYPSENFDGPVANVRLGSMLAYAAWAARWPPSEGFTKLRAIGINPLPELHPRDSAVQVLVGDLTSRHMGANLRVHVTTASAGETPLVLSAVAGLPRAAQAAAVLPPGPIRVGVEMRNFAPATFAVSLIPGFISVLTISREDDGNIEVQQYLNPIDPMVPVADGFAPPLKDDVRLVELAWRALEGRDPLDAVEHQGLIDAKRSNPLLGIIAGYRMLRSDRAHQFRVLSEPPSVRGKTASPLWNLVQFFPGLPDVHVLAGLYDTQRRDEHFARAIETGTPVLTEGFWTLVDWITSKAMQAGVAPPTLERNIVPGTVWTGFTEAAAHAGRESIRVLPSAGRPHISDRPRDRFVSLARFVGRLDLEGGSRALLGSCFLVGPQHVICPLHSISNVAEEDASGAWTLRQPIRVHFDVGDASTDRIVTRIVRALPPKANIVGDESRLSPDLLTQSWPVVLELSEPAAAAALALGTRPPEVAQRVVVIGFPRDDARIPSPTFAQHFVPAGGKKHVMPGAVVWAADNSATFEYDCFTTPGTSGGPVIDLETGTVVGMHVAALEPTERRNRGIAVAVTRFARDLSLLTANGAPFRDG
jgi:hypothetical protein